MHWNFELILTLINGVGILAILAVAYGAIRRSSFGSKGQAVLIGGATACAALLATMHPTNFGNECMLDSRSLIVGIGSAFGGPITALIAGSVTAAYRISIGGGGVVPGTIALGMSIAAGLAWNFVFFRKGRVQSISLLILGLGISWHAAPILMTESTPLVQLTVILGLGGSSIVSTLFLGSLMAREERMIRREAELSRMALRDPLTRVANRRGFRMALQAIAANSEPRPFALMVVDIDHFKAVNDRYGHTAGDFILQAVAAKLKLASGTDATVARFGGEEFVVLLDDTTLLEAHRIAENARRAIADWDSAEGETAIDVTASIGIAGGLTGTDYELLLRKADDALYRAKEDGRNCVRGHDDASSQTPNEVRETKAAGAKPARYAVAS
ncbi:diguanylate cyclase [Fulvimarina sp. MAC8]|uniref:GGDEF domain-containing protein n=1 Tax=Fulvimarina sp. MAC8 TaxID=3162874 RepID=UPI0032EF4A4A